MQNNVSSLRDTIIPKSDQLNAEQLLSGSITITVSGVDRGSADQPVIVYYHDDGGRPFKPCKSMRKILIFAWGDDGNAWIGRSMTLYNNPEVMFGGVKVGGIRISHLSHIEKDISVSLTATKGKKSQHIVKKLTVVQSPVDIARSQISETAQKGSDALRAEWTALDKKTRTALGEAFIVRQKEIAAAVDAKKEQVPEPQPEPAVNDDDYPI